jgi:TPR repeat protein
MINFWKNSSKIDKYFGATTLIVLIIGAVVFYGFTNVPFWDMTEPDKVQKYADSAEEGNPPAQAWIGVAYYTGDKGLQQDKDKAFKWLNKAAEQGHFTAIRNLINLFPEKSEVYKYVEYIEKYPHTLRPKMYYYLAEYYSDSNSVKFDVEKAHTYYLKSAMLGNVQSMYELVQYYVSQSANKGELLAGAWTIVLYKHADSGTELYKKALNTLYGSGGMYEVYDQNTLNRMHDLVNQISSQMFDFN